MLDSSQKVRAAQSSNTVHLNQRTWGNNDLFNNFGMIIPSTTTAATSYVAANINQ
jgi:hypothetical protein